MPRAFTSLSRNYVRSRTEENMFQTCRVERWVKGELSETTLRVSAPAKTVIYEGPVRIREISGSSSVVLGDDDLQLQSTQASFPWDVPEEIRKNDIIVLTADPHDATMPGRKFEIVSEAKAGDLRPSRRFVVQTIVEKGDHS